MIKNKICDRIHMTEFKVKNLMKKPKNNLTILIGHFLDHYDTHIYILLTPYIAQIFFADDLVLISLIKAHGIALIGLITRPIGGALFGRVADLIGPLKALRYSLVGVSVSTFLIGFLPGYDKIGYLAPILLLILRALQSIFSSGEGAIAGLYLISSNPGNKGFFSSIYALSTLLGMLFASGVCELISISSDPLFYWRVGFMLGFATSLVGLYIRGYHYQVTKITNVADKKLTTIIKLNKGKILRIALIYGFSYITYPLAFAITNSILPITKGISIAETFRLNTYLTIFDGLMIVVSGYILKFINLERLMIICSILLAFLASVLFWIIPAASVKEIMLMRILVIAVGIPFSIAVKVWITNATESCRKERYLISAIGGSIGMEVLGRSLIVWSLSFYNAYGNFILPIVYVIFLCPCAIYCIYSYPRVISVNNIEE